MPRRKPKPEKIVQENIKSTLDQILMDEGLDSDTLQPSDLPRLKTTDMMDFATAKSDVGNDARKLMESIVDFYLKENYIEKSDYIVYKQKIDAMNVSSMMLQLKTAQHAITKLLEEIDLGNANPRMFEVLAQLQSLPDQRQVHRFTRHLRPWRVGLQIFKLRHVCFLVVG